MDRSCYSGCFVGFGSGFELYDWRIHSYTAGAGCDRGIGESDSWPSGCVVLRSYGCDEDIERCGELPVNKTEKAGK